MLSFARFILSDNFRAGTILLFSGAATVFWHALHPISTKLINIYHCKIKIL